MGYRLRMPTQIRDWLVDLRRRDPSAAMEVCSALIAIVQSNELAGPPLVSRPPGAAMYVAHPDELSAMVDALSQDVYKAISPLRHQIAEARSIHTTTRQRITHHPDGRTEVESIPITDAEYAAANRREGELAARVAHWQGEVESFRARKDAAKARFTVAQATRDIEAASVAEAPGLDQSNAHAALAAAEQDVATAATALANMGAQAIRLIRSIARDVPNLTISFDHGENSSVGEAQSPRDDTPEADWPDVLVLEADPLGADICMLFAIERPGTIALLAVLEGSAAIGASRFDAFDLAAELLAEIRTDASPSATDEAEEDWLEFPGGTPFLEKFFPGNEGVIAARADVLRAAESLAGLRRGRGISLAELAKAIGVTESELWMLENGELGSATLHELGAYVGALGGSLTVTAEVDGEQRMLW